MHYLILLRWLSQKRHAISAHAHNHQRVCSSRTHRLHSTWTKTTFIPPNLANSEKQRETTQNARSPTYLPTHPPTQPFLPTCVRGHPRRRHLELISDAHFQHGLSSRVHVRAPPYPPPSPCRHYSTAPSTEPSRANTLPYPSHRPKRQATLGTEYPSSRADDRPGLKA